jgi:hypothetical protein
MAALPLPVSGLRGVERSPVTMAFARQHTERERHDSSPYSWLAQTSYATYFLSALSSALVIVTRHRWTGSSPPRATGT